MWRNRWQSPEAGRFPTGSGGGDRAVGASGGPGAALIPPSRFIMVPSLHPDWTLLLFFAHTHGTITMTLALLFIPKVTPSATSASPLGGDRAGVPQHFRDPSVILPLAAPSSCTPARRCGRRSRPRSTRTSWTCGARAPASTAASPQPGASTVSTPMTFGWVAHSGPSFDASYAALRRVRGAFRDLSPDAKQRGGWKRGCRGNHHQLGKPAVSPCPKTRAHPVCNKPNFSTQR